MIKDVHYFMEQFNQQIKENRSAKSGNTVYGSNVMPLLELYKNISSEEKRAFRETIKEFLIDRDDNKREFAINLCLGFVVFRDAI